MKNYFIIGMLFLATNLIGQTYPKYDSTLKIGKVGYRISCFNKSAEHNNLTIRPIGFKAEVREISSEIRARVLSAEIDDLNNDGFPEVIIFIEESRGNKSLFCISSKENERMEGIFFPDITDDMQLSKGYRGKDEFKLVEGVLFRKFPIFDTDTANKIPTPKMRQILYRVVPGEQGSWKFKAFRNFDTNATVQ
ncbi:MAG: hypothetical protein WCP61_01195 [Chitinophagia bacterium]|jgi:hypothetical protein